MLQRELAAGETLLVESDSVVAFTDGVKYDVQQVGTCITMCCAGEGCYNTALTGPGTIYIQSLSYERLVRLLVREVGGGAAGAAAGAGAAGGAPLGGEQMVR